VSSHLTRSILYSIVSKARLASQERDRIKMPWANKTFACTDAPREATSSTSEPISILLLTFTRFPIHSIELEPLLGSVRKHAREPIAQSVGEGLFFVYRISYG